jgi:hypothetical protein
VKMNFIKVFWDSTGMYELADATVWLFLNTIMNNWFPEK